MAQGLSDDLWKEKQQGTLRRWISTPAGPLPFLAAKLLSAAVLVFSVSLVILAIGMAYHELPFYRLPLALVWSTFAGLLFFTLMQLIQLYASSQRGGAILTMCIVFPLLMLGGSLFPLELMPAWMAALGRWTPNGGTLELLKDILLGRLNLAVLLVAVLFLTLVAVAGSLLAARRIPAFGRN
jgi:ABC-type multidrug transport system permease subunit